MKTILLILLVLAGCGGSDDPIDERKTIDPPNCSASGVCT